MIYQITTLYKYKYTQEAGVSRKDTSRLCTSSLLGDVDSCVEIIDYFIFPPIN